MSDDSKFCDVRDASGDKASLSEEGKNRSVKRFLNIDLAMY